MRKHADLLTQHLFKGRISLRVRLIRWLRIFTLTNMIFISASVVLFIHQAELSSWRSRQGDAARSASNEVTNALHNAQTVLSLAAMADRSFLEEHPDFLDTILAMEPTFAELVRLDAEGNLIAEAYRDTPVLSNMFTVLQSQWFLTARDGQPYQGDLRLSNLNEPYLIMSIPANDGDIVAGRVRMSVLQQAVASIQFGKSGSAFVVNLDGQVIAHSDPTVMLLGTNLKNRKEFNAILQSENYTWYGAYTNLQGARVFGYSLPVENTRWILVTEMEQSEVSSITRWAAMLLFVIILALALGLNQWGSRQLDRLLFAPLAQLQTAADELGKGNLNHRIRMERLDEIGRVSNTFDLMAERLQERENQLAANAHALAVESEARQNTAEELRRLNEELEQRVEQRTQELQTILTRILLLNRVISTGSSKLEPTHILEVLCRELAEAFHLPQAAFAAANEDGKSFTVVAEYRKPERPSSLGFTIPVEGNPLVSIVLETRQPLILNTDQYDPFLSEIRQEINRRGIVSMMLIPLVLRDKVVGTLGLDSIEPRQFTEEEVNLAVNVTTAAGQVYDNARLYAALQAELDERKHFEEILLHQSTHDSLTGLYNRSYFEEELKRLENSRLYPISVIMIDLDNLKHINDTLGHDAGDDYLKRSAGIFRSTFRNEDVTARIGGDEFAVLLPGIGASAVQTVIQRLYQKIETHNQETHSRPIELSMGAATALQSGDLLAALKQADQEMYRQKNEKRGLNKP